MITDEVFQNLPEPYRVGRYGYSPNKVAITFDDGPDPEWTPKILDVLKAKNATATFFLIGIQTDKFSGIAKRIYREGNTIGNHTFTHPDVSNISTAYMKVELNLTERLFASLIGIRATLMRPPYAIDEEPDTADQVRPLEIPQDMGFITVGNRIDPNDWSDTPGGILPKKSPRTSWRIFRRAGWRIYVVATSCCCMMAVAIAQKQFEHCLRSLTGSAPADTKSRRFTNSSGCRKAK